MRSFRIASSSTPRKPSTKTTKGKKWWRHWSQSSRYLWIFFSSVLEIFILKGVMLREGISIHVTHVVDTVWSLLLKVSDKGPPFFYDSYRITRELLDPVELVGWYFTYHMTRPRYMRELSWTCEGVKAFLPRLANLSCILLGRVGTRPPLLKYRAWVMEKLALHP